MFGDDTLDVRGAVQRVVQVLDVRASDTEDVLDPLRGQYRDDVVGDAHAPTGFTWLVMREIHRQTPVSWIGWGEL